MIRSHSEGTILEVTVLPRSSKTALRGEYDQRLKIALAAPPVEGAANDELVRFLAELLNCGKSAMEIIKGQQGKKKSVLLRGLDPADLAKRLQKVLAA